jgi:hypothetical protein
MIAHASTSAIEKSSSERVVSFESSGFLDMSDSILDLKLLKVPTRYLISDNRGGFWIGRGVTFFSSGQQGRDSFDLQFMIRLYHLPPSTSNSIIPFSRKFGSVSTRAISKDPIFTNPISSSLFGDLPHR